jgi:tRNA-dihydrouridine synthase 1
MVNQSDLPFRLLVRKYGATMAYTQMLLPDKLLNDRDYLAFHQRDLTLASSCGWERPVVVQLCGNEPEVIVNAGKKLDMYCDGIGGFSLYVYARGHRATDAGIAKWNRFESRVPARSCA